MHKDNCMFGASAGVAEGRNSCIRLSLQSSVPVFSAVLVSFG